MEIKKAKSLANDILDICSQLENETLSEACSGIYNDIQVAKSIQEVISSVQELMVFVNETNWDDMEDLKEEVEIKFNELLEEFEEF